MVRRAGIDDAPGLADLVRRAFSTQSRPTNPPSGALKETVADEAEREARRRGLARMTLGVRLELEDNRRLFASCGFEETTLHRHEGFSEPTWVTMERRLQ